MGGGREGEELLDQLTSTNTDYVMEDFGVTTPVRYIL